MSTSSQTQPKALDCEVLKSKPLVSRKSSSLKGPTKKRSGSRHAKCRDSEPEDNNSGLRRSDRNRPVRDPTIEESTNGHFQSNKDHPMNTEDLKSLVTGFTAVKPPVSGQNEFEKGKTQALRVVGQLISEKFRPRRRIFQSWRLTYHFWCTEWRNAKLSGLSSLIFARILMAASRSPRSWKNPSRGKEAT